MYDGGGSVYLYSYSMYRSGVLLRSRSVRWGLVLDRLYTRLAAGSSTKEQCLKKRVDRIRVETRVCYILAYACIYE